MKKIFLAVCCAGLAGAAFAQTTGSETRNNIRMVSYFPVPHVSYGEVNVKDELLLGASGASGVNFSAVLGTSSQVNNGKTSLVLLPKEGMSASVANLSASELIFQVKSGAANNLMDNTLLTLGSSSSAGTVSLGFSGKLKINSFTELGGLKVTEDGKVKNLYLFPEVIQGCSGNAFCAAADIAQAKDSSGNTCAHAVWKTLRVKKAGTENEYEAKTFLVCE